MFKSKEPVHGYTRALPMRPPLTSQAVAFHQLWPHKGGTRKEISRISWNECPAAHRVGVAGDKVLVQPQEASSWGGDLTLLSTTAPLAWHGGRQGALMPNPCPETPRPRRLQGARPVDDSMGR